MMGGWSFTPRKSMEAVVVREWVEAAGFVMMVVACYMMVVPI
jgi:hypothetical protein